MAQQKENFAKFLLLVGGVIGIIAGAMSMTSFDLMVILYGLIVILLSLAAIISAIRPGRPIPLNIVVAIPIGAVIIWLTWFDWWGLISGILCILAGIALLVDRD